MILRIQAENDHPAQNSQQGQLERFPIEWNHLIDQNSLKIKDLDRIPVSLKQGYGPKQIHAK